MRVVAGISCISLPDRPDITGCPCLTASAKRTVTIRLSDETAAMIDLKRKEWDLKSRGEVIERLLGWMVEPTDSDG